MKNDIFKEKDAAWIRQENKSNKRMNAKQINEIDLINMYADRRVIYGK